MAGASGLVRATGASPKNSLDGDDDNARDTTRLLIEDEDDDQDDEQRFQQSLAARKRAEPSRRGWSWAALSAAALAAGGVLGGVGLYASSSSSALIQSPPWHPSPPGGTHDSWAASYAQARRMVSQMSVLEKVNVTTGVGWASGFCLGDTAPAPSAGFPGLCLQDGPLGLRHVDNVTVFPAGVTVGATFNATLMEARGRAYGREARLKGVNAILGPSMGPLGKFPAGGRNWEGFGADPVLQGIAAAATVRGIQAEGVMATAKHLVGNEQEHFRQPFEWGMPHALSSNIADRALHELYAWPFADSVRAGVASVMCSYNMLNNSYACGNSKLLNGVLKDELGFQGFVMSDWLAQRAGVDSALAGLDVSMPGDGLRWADADSLWGPRLTAAVLNGSVPLSRLDDMAARVVAAWYQMGQHDPARFPQTGPSFSSWSNKSVDRIHYSSGEDNHTGVVNQFVPVGGRRGDDASQLARQIAAEGTVLVKNDGGLLPLAAEGWPAGKSAATEGRRFRVGVYGADAGPGRGPNSCPDRACIDGTLGIGWGSGTSDFMYLVTPLEGLQDAFDAEQVEVVAHINDTTSEASSAASEDLCIAFISATAGEGFAAVGNIRGDRPDLFAQRGGDELVGGVTARCGGPTVVVVHAVGPVLVERWIDAPGVRAVLLAHLPAQESGHALADVLLGRVDASGRLPYTVGRSLADYGPGAQIMYEPNAGAGVPQQDFADGVFVDYRHFDRAGIEPRFEFGFGLSYTDFAYEDLAVTTLKPRSELPPRPNALDPPSYDPQPLPAPADAAFPPGFRRVPKRVYPYLSAEDVARVEGERTQAAKRSEAEQDVQPHPLSPAGGAPGGHPALWEAHVEVGVTVRNVGKRRGSEVVQVYVAMPGGEVDAEGAPVEFPPRMLRAFDKIELDPGQQARVLLNLTRRDLSYWCVVRQTWVMPAGEIGVTVGRSSRDIREVGRW